MIPITRSVVLLSLIATGACSADTSPTAPTPPTAVRHATDADLVFCVQETNRYRAAVGAPPVTRSTTIEAYAALAAEHDARTRQPHGYTDQQRPAGTWTENVVPWWSLRRYGSVRETMRAGWSGFWSEGPGGGHYENMRSTRVTMVGCGVFIAGDEVTIVQHFRDR